MGASSRPFVVIQRRMRPSAYIMVDPTFTPNEAARRKRTLTPGRSLANQRIGVRETTLTPIWDPNWSIRS